jgi:hypothetical protein
MFPWSLPLPPLTCIYPCEAALRIVHGANPLPLPSSHFGTLPDVGGQDVELELIEQELDRLEAMPETPEARCFACMSVLCVCAWLCADGREASALTHSSTHAHPGTWRAHRACALHTPTH